MNFVTQLSWSCCPWVVTLVTSTNSTKSTCSHCLPSLVFAHQAPYPLLLACKFNLALAGAYLASALEDAENAASGTWPLSKPRGREQRYTKLKESCQFYVFRRNCTKIRDIICCVTSCSEIQRRVAQRARRETTVPFRALYMKPRWARSTIHRSWTSQLNKKRKSTNFCKWKISFIEYFVYVLIDSV